MALQEVLDSLDGLPEQFHEDYEKSDDGKFYLKIVKGLKSNNAAILAEKKRLQDQVKAFEGVDPEKAREALKKLQDMDEEAARKAGDFESLKKSMQEGFDREKASLQTEISFRDSVLERSLIEAEAAQAMVPLKGSPKLLMPHVKAQTKVERTETGFVGRVIDPATKQVRYNSKGEPMTVAELVAEMSNSEDYAVAFKAEGIGGGGAERSNPPGVKKTVTSKADLKRTKEKSAYIKEQGLAAWEALPAKIAA